MCYPPLTYFLFTFSLFSFKTNYNSLISYVFITTRDCIDIIKERNTTFNNEYNSKADISNDMIPGDVANFPIPEEYRYKIVIGMVISRTRSYKNNYKMKCIYLLILFCLSKRKYIKYTQQQINIIIMIYQMDLTRNQTISHGIEIVDMSRAY